MKMIQQYQFINLGKGLLAKTLLVLALLCLLGCRNIIIGVSEPSDALEDTRWELAYFVIDEKSSDSSTGQWLQFGEQAWFGFDSCNQISGNYKITERGGFQLLSLISTLQACHVVDEDGNRKSMENQEFNEALTNANSFEIKDDALWLYYSANEANALVFSSVPLPDED
jgi:heat shock protein HslJ